MNFIGVKTVNWEKSAHIFFLIFQVYQLFFKNSLSEQIKVNCLNKHCKSLGLFVDTPPLACSSNQLNYHPVKTTYRLISIRDGEMLFPADMGKY